MDSLCYYCKYAVYEGGDYCAGFGGCTTPEYVYECKNKNIQESKEYADMDFDEVKECNCYNQ